MSVSINLIEQLKAAYNLPSDYAVAKKLGSPSSTISGWRTGKHIINDSIALEIAELLELDPTRVVASLHIEQAKKIGDENLVQFWQKFVH